MTVPSHHSYLPGCRHTAGYGCPVEPTGPGGQLPLTRRRPVARFFPTVGRGPAPAGPRADGLWQLRDNSCQLCPQDKAARTVVVRLST